MSLLYRCYIELKEYIDVLVLSFFYQWDNTDIVPTMRTKLLFLSIDVLKAYIRIIQNALLSPSCIMSTSATKR